MHRVKLNAKDAKVIAKKRKGVLRALCENLRVPCVKSVIARPILRSRLNTNSTTNSFVERRKSLTLHDSRQAFVNSLRHAGTFVNEPRVQLYQASPAEIFCQASSAVNTPPTPTI